MSEPDFYRAENFTDSFLNHYLRHVKPGDPGIRARIRDLWLRYGFALPAEMMDAYDLGHPEEYTPEGTRADMLAILKHEGWCPIILELPERRHDPQEVRAWCNEKVGPQWWNEEGEHLTAEGLKTARWMCVAKDYRTLGALYAFKDENDAFAFRMRWT